MKHFFDGWPYLKQEFSAKSIFLFLDYDGTLVPLAPAPREAVISPQVRKTLSDLSRLPAHYVGIVSGRELRDIKKRVGLKKITYVGNHGFEIEGPGIHFKSLVDLQFKKGLGRIRDQLREQLKDISGAWVEDKGITLSVHYRRVRGGAVKAVKNIFAEIARPCLENGQIKVLLGKKVFEIRPPVQWDKGEAVRWLIKQWQPAAREREAMAVYLGDDTTDEDAFRMLKKSRGITIHIGKGKKSCAEYYLKDPGEVKFFLEQVLDLKRGAHDSRT